MEAASISMVYSCVMPVLGDDRLDLPLPSRRRHRELNLPEPIVWLLHSEEDDVYLDALADERQVEVRESSLFNGTPKSC